MRRMLIQLDEATYSALRQHAFDQKRSMSSLVRELVATGLDGGTVRTKRRRVAQFTSVGAGRSKQGRLAPVSEKHDQALAAAFEK